MADFYTAGAGLMLSGNLGRSRSIPPLFPTIGWYDASDESSITVSGGFAVQWNDLSGNNRHLAQSTGGASLQPTTYLNKLNNRNTITYIDNYNRLAIFSGTVTLGSVYIAGYLNTTQSGVVYNLFQGGDRTLQRFIAAGGSGNPKWYQNDNVTTYGSINYTQNSAFAIGVLIQGANVAGSLINLNGTDGTPFTSTSSDVSTGYSIGGRLDRSLSSYIGELLIYTEKHNSTERSSIMTYLKNKWGTP